MTTCDPKSTPVRIYTARIDYTGPARIDVTRRGGSPFGPNWATLAPVLKIRAERAALEKMRAVTLAEVDAKSARRIELETQFDAAWQDYSEKYLDEMRLVWRTNRAAWQALSHEARKQSHLVLVCYCTDSTRCHRTVLASLLVRAFARLHEPIAAELGEPPELPRSKAIVCFRGSKKSSTTITNYVQPKEAEPSFGTNLQRPRGTR